MVKAYYALVRTLTTTVIPGMNLEHDQRVKCRLAATRTTPARVLLPHFRYIYIDLNGTQVGEN
jgi:hypothetical protein